jgi:uncharacterized protein YtpQ (UPF0354 family)
MRFLDRFRKPSEQKFAELFITGLRASGDTRSWAYDKSQNRLVPTTSGNGEGFNFINLPNMYREYLQARPAERKDVLKRQTGGMIRHAMPALFADARARLRPVIRSATERGVTYLQTQGSSSRFDIAFRPLCENLEIGVAYDGDLNIMRLTQAKLREWNTTFDEAYDIALDNLRGESSKPFVALRDGVLASQFGDHYDAARLLLPDLLHRQNISGAPVVMAPNRTVLLLTGDRNTAGLATMVQIAEEALAQPRALPPLMLRWDGTVWQRFVPAELEPKLSELRFNELAGDYHDQQKLLNDMHSRTGLDIFVAQYTVVKRHAGGIFSLCVWTQGVHALLPATDTVVLFRQEPKQTAYVPWSELVKECGHLLKPTDDLPVRYEVTAFPDERLFQSWCTRFSQA